MSVGVYAGAAVVFGGVSGALTVFRVRRMRYVPAIGALLFAAGFAVFAAKLAWLPSAAQRLADDGVEATAHVVRVTRWDRAHPTQTISYDGKQPATVPLAVRAVVRYDAGTVTEERDVALSYLDVSQAQLMDGTDITGVAVEIVYDPTHPAYARNADAVERTPHRVAASWTLAFYLGLAGLVSGAVAWTIGYLRHDR